MDDLMIPEEALQAAVDGLAEAFQVLADAIVNVVKQIVDVICKTISQWYDSLLKCFSNKRVVHLAFHAKKKRIRKKNRNRL